MGSVVHFSFLAGEFKPFYPARVQAWLENQNGGRYPFVDNCSIGRLPGSVVTLDDKQVSRRHALITKHGENDHWLIDFGSSNGTRLNGVAVTEPRRLKNGDVIEINTHKLLFREKRNPFSNSNAGQNAAAWEETEKKFTAYQSTGQGVVVVAANGHVQAISPHAREWLQNYFPKKGTKDDLLPKEIVGWLEEQSGKKVTKGSFARTGLPLVVAHGDKRLRVQLADGGGGEQVLLFNEEQLIVAQTSLQRLGLTVREGEVMFWVAEGKTNAEIGAILGSSPRTVERHVASIFKKLGVENRVAAVRSVAEKLSLRPTHDS